jgi:hypothetical protein
MDDVAIRKSSDPKAFKFWICGRWWSVYRVFSAPVTNCCLLEGQTELLQGAAPHVSEDRKILSFLSFHFFCYRKDGMMAQLGFDFGSVSRSAAWQKDGIGSSLLAPPCLAQSRKETNLPVPFDWCCRCLRALLSAHLRLQKSISSRIYHNNGLR